jgi:hypothetical protein
MSSFLSQLGKIINNQLGTGETTTPDLNLVKNTNNTLERTYIEDGFIRDIRPNKRSVLYQQPDIYIVIKKRMFSSLAENSKMDLLEQKERMFVSASKKLFQNKCKVLSIYEKLTKIEKITVDSERFNTFLTPFLTSLLDSSEISKLFNISDKTIASIRQLRNVMSYSKPEQFTKWTTNDWDSVFANQVGEGTGTFEITNVSSISTNGDVEWGQGKCSFTMEDPYNLLSITESDIDQALSDVLNPMRTGATFKFTANELQNKIDELKQELRDERLNRVASQIEFKISSGTISSKRVRAIFDNGTEINFQYTTGFEDTLNDINKAKTDYAVMASLENIFSSGTVHIEPQFVRGNDLVNINQNDQLSPAECELFVRIISYIFLLIDQQVTSQSELKERNKEINYARNRMKLFFQGKYIIQPMDVVSVFMTSRTGEDKRMPSGYSSQIKNNNALKFDNILKNIDNQLKDLSSSSTALSFDDIERISTVGQDFPKWLWKQFRQDITNQPTGPCVFYGLVSNSGGSYSNGVHKVQISCSDNTNYFDKGLLNYQPSAEVFNSSIYDPLTPFDLSIDAATGMAITDINSGDFPALLPENQALLLSGVTTFKNGPEKGRIATLENFQKSNKEVTYNELKDVLYPTDGMVYRWKQGIQTLTKTGRPYTQTSIEEQRTALLTHQPFAGQDVMNVLSLLVTGQPYNYNTFLKAAIDNGNSLGTDKTLSSTATYIQGLISDIEKRNFIWGNFVPYKKLTVNQNLNKFITQTNFNITTINETLKRKLKERAQLEDDMILQHGGNTETASAFKLNELGQKVPIEGGSAFDNTADCARQTKIDELNSQISDLQNQLQKTIDENPDIGLNLIGNDVYTNNSLNSDQTQREELQLRQNTQRYTARRFWQVKANEDKNLFIVDDQYDTNFDILAFERKIGNKINLFNSQYANTSDKLKSVSQLLGLEIFANSQGHIVVKPPSYNRMPSSVFYKMFKDQDKNGTKVFPDFLESLYKNQIKGVFEQISIIEDEIRLRAVALGAKDDTEIRQLLTSGSDYRGVSDQCIFLTQFPPDNTEIGPTSVYKINMAADSDFEIDYQKDALVEVGSYEKTISNILKINRLFDTGAQAEAASNWNHTVLPDTQTDVLEQIRSRIKIKTGREAQTLDQLFGNSKTRQTVSSISQTDRINIFSQISNFVSQRQTLLKSASNALKSLREGVSSNSNTSSTITPYLYNKSNIPEYLEHMLEYEDEDDIGPDSGKRFVITPSMIESFEMHEQPPSYTMVTVNGAIDKGIIDVPKEFELTSDGNMITSAFAVDYDLWCQYGFTGSQAIQAPFFHDPDTQCAPYAVANLIKCKENILQATCSVTAYNEYYQLGDVVYIEHKGLLFYVTGISHSFTYGSKLSTKLTLKYGHTPGEYIPTMLDVVGKILYNSKGILSQYRTERYEMIGLAKSLGALVVEPTNTLVDDEVSADDINSLLKGKFGERNKNILSNILYSVSGSLNQINFRNKKSYIKIICYKTSTSNISTIQKIANNVSEWLIYPEQKVLNNLQSLSLNSKNTTEQQQSFGINKEDIIIEIVDLDFQQRTRISPVNNIGTIQNKQGPSSAAMHLARSLDINTYSFKEMLANSVIDIFVDYEDNTKTITETNGISQSEQDNNNSINTARTSLSNRI